jgi:hypothetical protein
MFDAHQSPLAFSHHQVLAFSDEWRQQKNPLKQAAPSIRSDEVFPPARHVRLTPGTRWRAGGIASVVRRPASDSAAVLDQGAALLGFAVAQSWHTCTCEGFGFEYTQRFVCSSPLPLSSELTLSCVQPHHNDRCCHRCGRRPTPLTAATSAHPTRLRITSFIPR